MSRVSERTMRNLIRRYGRAIVHMRQRKNHKRFGLMIGAGASIALGFPSWPQLVDRIAADKRVRGKTLLKRIGKQSTRSQVLFRSFCRRRSVQLRREHLTSPQIAARLKAEWKSVVHASLYADVPSSLGGLKNRDPYLRALLPLVRDSALTINYNFDDTLERLLLDEPRQGSARPYSSVWRPNPVLHPELPTIYHPNGFLPFDYPRDRASDELVFLEDAFADQLIASMRGHYSGLLSDLGQTTRLLVGLSLEDSTLRHLLRQSALMHPATIHYYIKHVRKSRASGITADTAIFEANFDIYNLYTLFLTPAETRALAHLLSLPSNELRGLFEEEGEPTAYRFMLTGSVGVGKSTALSFFSNVMTFEEWPKPLVRGMEEDTSRITTAQKRAIAKFVNESWAKKNRDLREQKEGIYVVDRAPLDFFAFENEGDWPKRAKEFMNTIQGGKANRKLLGSCVVIMTGNPEVMTLRATSKHKSYESSTLDDQQETLLQIYNNRIDKGFTELATHERNPVDVARELARIVHVEPYKEANLHGRIKSISSNGAVRGPPIAEST